MPQFHLLKSLVAVAALTVPLCSATGPGPAAEERAAIPDFSSHDAAWVFGTGDFIPIAGEPSPTRNDPAHAYISNNDFRATGKQPTYRVADLTNPNIKPWARRS